MKTVVPIILFVAVAGFHSVVSASLESAESNESSEESVSEEHTTPTRLQKHDELEYGAAHVKDVDSLGVNHTEEGNDDKESDDRDVSDQQNTDDGENEALTCTTEEKEEKTGSESTETDSGGDSSKHTTEHNKQIDDSVGSAEDFSDEETGYYY